MVINSLSEAVTSVAIYKLSSVCRVVVSARLYLVAGRASWLQSLSMVAAAVDLPVLVEVDEVYQELFACAAHEAGRVPTNAVAGSGCKYSDVTTVDLSSTLRKKKQKKQQQDFKERIRRKVV